MKYLLIILLICLGCSRLEYQEVCEDKNGTYDEDQDFCSCNDERFNPYTNKECEVYEEPEEDDYGY